MAARGAAFIAGVAAVLGAATGAYAQTGPGQTTAAERAAEGAAMLKAAGFQVRGTDILNPCGRPVRPRPAPFDLNGDGRPEAVIGDTDTACYGGTGEAFVIIQRTGPAQWVKVGGSAGRWKLLETRSNGWLDWTLEGAAASRIWGFQPGQGYVLKTAEAAAALAPPAAGALGAADRAAAFKAAGFSPTRGKYLACDPRMELTLEFHDLNVDGRPDAVITDSGLECFGNTGEGFTLVTREANGAWKKMFASPGIPTFLATRGVGGWPDLVNGGPGFCFPIMRWNGSDYVIVRWKEDQRGACAGRR